MPKESITEKSLKIGCVFLEILWEQDWLIKYSNEDDVAN